MVLTSSSLPRDFPSPLFSICLQRGVLRATHLKSFRLLSLRRVRRRRRRCYSGRGRGRTIAATTAATAATRTTTPTTTTTRTTATRTAALFADHLGLRGRNIQVRRELGIGGQFDA